MASAKCEPVMGFWVWSPQLCPGTDHLVEESGGFHLFKLKAFCLSEVQMRCKFVSFCYPVNCSYILFERCNCQFLFDVNSLVVTL